MNIMAAVSIEDVLHNDLSPNNVLLHFPINDDNVVNIGVCDWGLATWIGEVAHRCMGNQMTLYLTNGRSDTIG
jgi:hypothetical protein